MTSVEVSCGAIVFTRQGGQRRYLIVQSLEGWYGFPKGHTEPGETEEETALREIWEETGVRPRLAPGFRVVDEHPIPGRPGILKRIVYFLAEYEDQPIRFQKEELQSAALMTAGEAMAAFQFESSGRLLSAAEAFLERA